MSKHKSADEKLVSDNLRKVQQKPNAPNPKDYTAPNVPKVGTNQKNQYR